MARVRVRGVRGLKSVRPIPTAVGTKGGFSAMANLRVEFDVEHLLSADLRAAVALADGIEEAANDILDLAKEQVPVQSGALRDSGRVITDKTKMRSTIIFGEELPDGRAIFAEFGSVFKEARPFLYPAAAAIPIRSIVLKHLKKISK